MVEPRRGSMRFTKISKGTIEGESYGERESVTIGKYLYVGIERIRSRSMQHVPRKNTEEVAGRTCRCEALPCLGHRCHYKHMLLL